MNLETAKALVLDYIKLVLVKSNDNPPMIINELIVDLSWGWMFYYNSIEFFENQNIEKAYTGNVPIMFDKYKKEIREINFNFADDFKISSILKEYAALNSYEWDDSLCDVIDGDDSGYEFEKIELE